MLARCRRGVAAVEFAVIAPVLILCILGIIEVGRGIWLTNDLQNTGSRLARWAYLTIGAEDIATEAGRAAMLAALTAELVSGGYSLGVAAAEISLAETTFTASSLGCAAGDTASDARATIVLRWRFQALIEELVPWDFDLRNEAFTPLQCNPGS